MRFGSILTGVLLIILLPTEVVGVMESAVATQYPQRAVLELIGLSSLQYRVRGL
jgi:hypothetical protein